MTSSLPIIGWREWVSLPGLGIRRIKAKVDTGARSCSLHAFDVATVERDGKTMVQFTIHPRQHNNQIAVSAEAELLEFRQVRSSTGHESQRPVVRTEVEVQGERFEIELTLADRDAMGFRMLLGRQAIRGKFLVDPDVSYRGGRPKRKKRKNGSH